MLLPLIVSKAKLALNTEHLDEAPTHCQEILKGTIPYLRRSTLSLNRRKDDLKSKRALEQNLNILPSTSNASDFALEKSKLST